MRLRNVLREEEFSGEGHGGGLLLLIQHDKETRVLRSRWKQVASSHGARVLVLHHC